MNPLRSHQALLAAQTGRAQPRATRRHSHLSDRPLVIVGYHLAGDIGAPLALMWGTDREHPSMVVVPEPRNRALRFEALRVFGTQLVDYLDGFSTQQGHTVGRAGQQRQEFVCTDAPQLVLANPATADWLFGIVGRFTRNLRLDGDPPAPPIVPTAGKHLSFFDDRVPGGSLVLVATDLLTTHWQTGQLPSEDLNLPALLGWIDPPPGMDGRQAAAAVEDEPPAGPITDPNWDARHLQQIIQDWHAAADDAGRARVRARLTEHARHQLRPAWDACWQALDLTAALPPAAHVMQRWFDDRRSWTRHRDRVAADSATFRNVPTPLQAARKLRRLENRTTELAHQMATDDPMILAADVATGEAMVAEVVSVDATNRQPGRNGRTGLVRPLLTLSPLIAFTRPVGTIAHLADRPSVVVELVENDDAACRVQVNGGALAASTRHLLPTTGDVIWLSTRDQPRFDSSPDRGDTPWTHAMPDEERPSP